MRIKRDGFQDKDYHRYAGRIERRILGPDGFGYHPPEPNTTLPTIRGMWLNHQHYFEEKAVKTQDCGI